MYAFGFGILDMFIAFADMGNVDEGLKGIAVVDGDIDPCIGLLVVGVNCKDGSKG